MILNFDNLIWKSIDKFSYVSNSTGDIFFVAEELNDHGTLTNGEDTVFGTGSNGGRISSMKKNKTSSYTFTNGYISLNQMATQSGTAVEIHESKTLEAEAVELLEVEEDGESVTLPRDATGVAGAEILSLYKAQADNTQGERFKQGTAASATEFAYAPATKKITLPTSKFSKGDRVLLRYNYLTKGKRVSNPQDSFSLDGRAILEGTVCAPCDQETLYVARFVIPYSTSSGAYAIGFGGDQVTHPFTCESVPNPCDKRADLWYFIVEEDDEE